MNDFMDRKGSGLAIMLLGAGILVFSVPLLMGMGWTFSIALSLTTMAGLKILSGLGILIFA